MSSIALAELIAEAEAIVGEGGAEEAGARSRAAGMGRRAANVVVGFAGRPACASDGEARGDDVAEEEARGARRSGLADSFEAVANSSVAWLSASALALASASLRASSALRIRSSSAFFSASLAMAASASAFSRATRSSSACVGSRHCQLWYEHALINKLTFSSASFFSFSAFSAFSFSSLAFLSLRSSASFCSISLIFRSLASSANLATF